MNNQLPPPKKGFKFEFPGLADWEEDYDVRKGMVRRTYGAVFFIFLVVSSIYYYNLDPIKELPDNVPARKMLVASFCADQTPLEFKQGDIQVSTKLGFIPVIRDTKCDNVNNKLRDYIFTEYKEGNVWFVDQRETLTSYCKKTCEATRNIVRLDLKDCHSRTCLRDKFNLVVNEMNKPNSSHPWKFRDFDKIMKEDPEMVQAIYQSLLKRYLD